ncbi:MAG: 50S ribosomal protein L6 [Deltaproteobacteria bacterium]|nr:50S ribosomal protein L6 [Deltaproteobacteria bacterium]
MSRVGKQPIPVPEKVTVHTAAGVVTVKGPLGTLSRSLSPHIDVAVADKSVVCTRKSESREARMLHGLSRALVNNMVEGVSVGFRRELDLVGVGYKAELKGNALHLTLGYSHPVVFTLPDGVKGEAKLTRIALSSANKELLGETAARLRRLRTPDRYKGKGVRYSNEVIKTKPGKAAATSGAKKAG